MKTIRFKALIAVLVIVFIIFHLGRVFAGPGETSVLTEAQVQKFLKVLPAFAQWIKKNSATMDQLAEKSDAMQIIAATSLAKDHQKFFEKQGWTYEEFSNTAQQVLSAYAAVETGGSLAEARKELEAQRAEAMGDMQNNPNLTPEQKQMMLQQFKQAEESMKTAQTAFKDVPPANMALAKKHRDAIAKALEALE